MLRRLGVLFLVVLLLAGCNLRKSDMSTRGSYAVDVDAPAALLPTPAPTLSSAPSPTTVLLSQARVAVPLLNVRAGPTADAELLGQVKQDDLLPILERDAAGDWLRIALPDGQMGWVAAEYVSLEAAAAPAETAVVATPVPPGVIPPGAVAVQLAGAVDGKTIEVTDAGTPETVRLIGVDTPERDQPGYGAATRATRDLLTPTLYLVADRSDRDPGGNLLRYVYTEAGLLVNAELIRQGWALPEEVPPDTARAADFHLAAGEAAASGRGFWGGAGADGAQVYALAQGNINIRSGPGTDFEVSSTAPDGTPLLVVGRTRAGDWLKVRAPDTAAGWVSARLLALAVDVDSVPVVEATN